MLIVPLKRTRAIGGMADSKSGAGTEFKKGLEHFAIPKSYQRLLRICQNSADNLKRLHLAKDGISNTNNCNVLEHFKYLSS